MSNIPLPPSRILSIILQFTNVDGTDVPARVMTPFRREELLTEEQEQLLEMDPESLMPAIPPELVPQDLTSMLLDYERWSYLEEVEEEGLVFRETTKIHPRLQVRMADTLGITMEELYRETVETVSVRIGTSYRSIPYRVNRLTPLCYGCRRPLELYCMSLRDNEGWPRGYCPLHILHNEWRKQWTVRNELVQRDSSRSRKVETLEDYIKAQTALSVSSWAQQQRVWWADQKSNQSPLYCQWREQKMSELTSRSRTSQ